MHLWGKLVEDELQCYVFHKIHVFLMLLCLQWLLIAVWIQQGLLESRWKDHFTLREFSFAYSTFKVFTWKWKCRKMHQTCMNTRDTSESHSCKSDSSRLRGLSPQGTLNEQQQLPPIICQPNAKTMIGKTEMSRRSLRSLTSFHSACPPLRLMNAHKNKPVPQKKPLH